MKRLGILGTFVWDTVWTLGDQAAGRPFESWGGMAFSLATAAAAARPEGWEIVPIAHIGEDLVESAHGFLDTLEGIGPRGAVVPVPQANNRVELVYADAERRGERMRGGVPGWSWEELAPHLEGLDALCINFFAGWELSLPVAEALARAFTGPVYADLHSLFLGPPRDGPRLPRRLPDGTRWLGCFDAVQLNQDERALLTGVDLRRKPPGELLEHGPDVVLVTLGEQGASYASAERSSLRPGLRGGRRIVAGGRGHVLPPERVEGGDPTGSGDVWGAAACCALLGGLPLEQAVQRANAAAVVKMRHRGGTGLFEHLCAHRDEWEVDGPGGG
ncbi:MAG TPA: carbohydrate kinase family protein [Longimicrobium sp.]|nr:carbohydrate kinase family protein [Longimicrobium sp.]